MTVVTSADADGADEAQAHGAVLGERRRSIGERVHSALLRLHHAQQARRLGQVVKVDNRVILQ